MATNFQQRVFQACKNIPTGKVTTYKALAKNIGIKSARAIGQALKTNPYAPQVPCHRVIKSDGTLGGYYGATRGAKIQEKIKLLQSEGIIIKNNKINLDLFGYHW